MQDTIDMSNANNIVIHGGNNTIKGKANTVHTHGGFINIYGEVNELITHGGFVNDFRSGQEIIKKEVIYKENPVSGNLENNPEIIKLKEQIRNKEKENKSLADIICQRDFEINALRSENQELQEELSNSSAVSLEKRIAELEDKLIKAKNRERVLKAKADDAEKNLIAYKNRHWDEYKPTKDEVGKFYRIMLGLLDCENEDFFK